MICLNYFALIITLLRFRPMKKTVDKDFLHDDNKNYEDDFQSR